MSTPIPELKMTGISEARSRAMSGEITVGGLNINPVAGWPSWVVALVVVLLCAGILYLWLRG